MIDIQTLIENKHLYRTTLPSGEEFTWRLLTMKEYDVFRRLREAGVYPPLVLYSEVFDYCYQGVSEVINGNLPAGYFSAIGELIMWLSGDSVINNEKQEIEEARSKYNTHSVTETIKRVILMAFPSYTPDSFNEWTRDQLMEKFVIAEAVLVGRGGQWLLDGKGNPAQVGVYQPINVKNITTANAAGSPIDIKKENEEYAKAMGDGQSKHILDQHPSVLANKAAKHAQLSRAAARSLDRATARR